MKTNKENNIPKPTKRSVLDHKLLQLTNMENRPGNISSRVTPKQTLFEKIQRAVEISKDSQPLSYHQQKIREKLTKFSVVNTKSNNNDSEESFNIWEEELSEEENLFTLYEKRYNTGSERIEPDKVVRNIRQLLGINLQIKNIGNYPWFTYGQSKENLYYLPLSKAWKFKGKQQQNKTQVSRVSNQHNEMLKKMNSPDILRLKCYR